MLTSCIENFVVASMGTSDYSVQIAFPVDHQLEGRPVHRPLRLHRHPLPRRRRAAFVYQSVRSGFVIYIYILEEK